MSRFIQKQGFTLIELMVVIVIIGVLASLAIPRFSEASAKAKMSEAPLVLKSFESGVLSATVEQSKDDFDALKFEDIVMDPPKDSKWWDYGEEVNPKESTVSNTPYKGKARGKMGTFPINAELETKYNTVTSKDGEEDVVCFEHKASDADNDVAAKKMVPMFINSGCIAMEKT